MWIELNFFCRTWLWFFFPHQLYSLCSTTLNECFSSGKAIKKLAWHYQLIGIRWPEWNNFFFSRGEDSKLILILMPFPKCSFFLYPKHPNLNGFTDVVCDKAIWERLPHVFQLSFSSFREVLHLWTLLVPSYNFLEYLWVISCTWLSQ